jgi:hypothetical protein
MTPIFKTVPTWIVFGNRISPLTLSYSACLHYVEQSAAMALGGQLTKNPAVDAPGEVSLSMRR